VSGSPPGTKATDETLPSIEQGLALHRAGRLDEAAAL
jgi:hypothetical protein